MKRFLTSNFFWSLFFTGLLMMFSWNMWDNNDKAQTFFAVSLYVFYFIFLYRISETADEIQKLKDEIKELKDNQVSSIYRISKITDEIKELKKNDNH